MEKTKKRKRLSLALEGLFVATALGACLLLLIGHYLWSEALWYRVLNPFLAFPLPSDDVNYVGYMALRLLALAFLVVSLTHLARVALSALARVLKRGRSLASLLSSFAKYLGAIVLIFAALGTLGVDTAVLLASAGILSLVVGLGAQPLIEDIFAGIFIVFEKTFEIGDIIVVDGFRGTVKEMGIRTTKIEDAGGDVKVVNNSDIRTLINMTSKLSTAVCDVSIGYAEDIEKVEKVLAEHLPEIKAKCPAIVNGPSYVGVQSLAESAVVIRIIAECNETMRYQVQRDINREIKIILDRNGIEIPYPQIVVHEANGKSRP